MEKEWLEDNAKNTKKKTILSAIFVVALLVIVGGIAVAAFTTTLTSNDNTVNTGRISMSYSEPSNALILENALPMEDSEGASQSKFFEFTVSTHATTNANDDTGITIPYEINISDLTIDGGYQQLTKSFVKVNLVKVDGTTETEVVTPTLLSNMTTSTLREGAASVYKTSDTHKNNSAAKTTTYRLRAWLDKSFDAASEDSYQYKFSVNVNSQVNAVGVESPADATLLRTAILGDNNSNVVSSGNGLYVSTETNDGRPTYYYKGATVNNYVKMGTQTYANPASYCGLSEEYLAQYGYNNLNSDYSSWIDESRCVNPSGLYLIINEDGSYWFNDVCLSDECVELNESMTEWVSAGALITEDLEWRVVRVNENGTIKMILNQAIKDASWDYSIHGDNPNPKLYGWHVFNNNYDSYEYAYYSESNVEGGVKKDIDNWYASNMSQYDSSIASTNFCEAARVGTDYGNGIKLGNATLANMDSYVPNFKCPMDANNKQYVDSKVGLVTVEEVMLSKNDDATYLSSYKNKGSMELFWTMSPTNFDGPDGSFPYVWALYTGGSWISRWVVKNSGGGAEGIVIRPVINLNANVAVTGTGEAGNPWVVQ